MSNLPSEPEFEQALKEVESSLATFLEKHPEYKKALEIVQIPERVIQFRVVWEGQSHCLFDKNNDADFLNIQMTSM
jgi:glutamate dehydrogenase (NADP+)